VADAPGLIEARELTKRFGDRVAVDHLSFRVEPGKVTGFLGPNGAGKSTTMRLIVGLDRPQSGSATIGGLAYHQIRKPLKTVGALLEARALHPGRSARNNLLFLAETQGFPARRVDEVIDMVGLRDVARKRVGGFSLGMTQRLGIASAMLGDPRVLMLDEPVNGLDPEGIRWVRNFMRELASEGRTVFVSSHLMSEMSVTADYLIVIGRGKLIADCTTEEFIERSSQRSVLVRSPDEAKLRELITAAGGEIQPAKANGNGVSHGAGNGHNGGLVVTGLPAARIGELAASQSLVLHELTPQLPSLEEAFMELTADSVEYGDRRAS
jgi:ABC-2 type transport system ATP-binding protein